MSSKATEEEFKEFHRLNLKFAEFDRNICSSCEYNHLCHPLESTYRIESILICCKNKEIKRVVKKIEEMKKGKPIDYFDFTLADEERIKWEEEVFEEFKRCSAEKKS
ncbi:MAG: hypothetical protein QMD80_05265 [archaeon]|nr:hypothetical protein [archaeon]